MKKLLAVFVIFVVILVVGVACHKSSSSAPPPPTTTPEPTVPVGPLPSSATPAAVFNTPQQAAAGFAALAGTQAAADTQFQVAVALGLNSQPPGFAPPVSKSSDIGKVDPVLATMMAEMTKLSRSAAIQSVVKKVGALKAMRATSVSTTVTADVCSNTAADPAVVTINGTNNYDEATNPAVTSSYDINFTNCKDDILFTQLDGNLHIESVRSTDNNGVTSTLVAKALTEKTFSAADLAVMTKIAVMDGEFISDNQVVRGARSSTGTFVVTTPQQGAVAEKVETFNYNGLVETSTFTHNADGSDTAVTTTQGSFSVTSATGGNTTLKLDLALNLKDETLALNDPAGTTNNKISGDVDMKWTPPINGCAEGKYTISTVDTAPRIFKTVTGACPINGTVKVNNAVVNYEPAGQPIQVAVDTGTPQTFADCAAFDAAGGACSF